MIRVGIIGMGFMGRTHYGAYEKLPGVQVVAIADSNPKVAGGDLSGGWGNIAGGAITQLPMDRIKGTTDPNELLQTPDIDVIDVCLPTPMHADFVPKALASGKHVLCEKPLARTLAEAQSIAAAASRAKGFFMPAMCMRFWGEWEWLKRAVAEQHYGAVLAASFQRVGVIPAGWFGNGAMSGGALLDLHVHDTDFIFHLFGLPTGVFSRGYVGKSGEIDHVMTQYLYNDGAAPGSTRRGTPMITAEGSWTATEGFGFRMRYTVQFERTTADFDLFNQPSTLLLSAGGKKEPVTFDHHNGYTGELSYFLECVRTGQKPHRVTADDGVAGLRILEAERRSIETGRAEVV